MLVMDLSIVQDSALQFQDTFKDITPHFAVKANPDPHVLRTLLDAGTRFEIASPAELDSLIAIGVRPKHVLYSNPVKTRAHIEYAARLGVKRFAVDSLNELEKIVALPGENHAYLRITTPQTGSAWPLDGKFGMPPEAIPAFLHKAMEMRAYLAGVAFHVGSQCSNLDNWTDGLASSYEVLEEMLDVGFSPYMVNLGGGFPVPLTRPVPTMGAIAATIEAGLADWRPRMVVAEPGRSLVSEAGCFVMQVVATSHRDGKKWLHVDAGVFGGLFELFEGIEYQIDTDRDGEATLWDVGGPTCDSIDVLLRDFPLPNDLREGDFLYVRNAGAYSTAYASRFNGFELPDVRLVSKR
jgi:ornithine decarboxylase